MRASLRKALGIVKATERHGTFDMSQRWEEQYCRNHDIPYREPGATGGRVQCIRNCPVCAQMGYHCNLYQYPWFKRCPIHNTLLTYHCPQCLQLWPLAKELQSRKCPVCGVDIRYQDWSTEFENDQHPAFGILKIIQATLLAERVNLSDSDFIHHDAISDFHFDGARNQESIDWPSLVHRRPEGWSQVCSTVGAPLQEVKEFSITSKQQLRQQKFFYRLAESQKLRQYFFALIEKAWRSLAKKVQSLESNAVQLKLGKKASFGVLRTLSSQEVFRFAYAYWRVRFYRHSGEASTPHKDYFEGPGFPEMPDLPEPLLYVLNSERLRKSDGQRSSLQKMYLPEYYSLLLFRSELWRLFLGMYGHLEALNAALLENWTFEDYYNRLPQDSLVRARHPAILRCNANGNSSLKIIMLSRHVEVTRESLQQSRDIQNQYFQRPRPELDWRGPFAESRHSVREIMEAIAIDRESTAGLIRRIIMQHMGSR